MMLFLTTSGKNLNIYFDNLLYHVIFVAHFFNLSIVGNTSLDLSHSSIRSHHALRAYCLTCWYDSTVFTAIAFAVATNANCSSEESFSIHWVL